MSPVPASNWEREGGERRGLDFCLSSSTPEDSTLSHLPFAASLSSSVEKEEAGAIAAASSFATTAAAKLEVVEEGSIAVARASICSHSSRLNDLVGINHKILT